MDHLMQANLQIIELLGAVFEEVERHEECRRRTQAGERAAAEDQDVKGEDRWQ